MANMNQTTFNPASKGFRSSNWDIIMEGVRKASVAVNVEGNAVKAAEILRSTANDLLANAKFEASIGEVTSVRLPDQKDENNPWFDGIIDEL